MKLFIIIVALAVANVLAENQKYEEYKDLNKEYKGYMQGRRGEKYGSKEWEEKMKKDDKEWEEEKKKMDDKKWEEEKIKMEDKKREDRMGSERYTDKYDSMDLDSVVGNKRMMQAYSRCMLDQGKCTTEGKELKSHISEALQNGCSKCTNTQRQGMRKVIKYYMEKEPETWEQLCEKYDPKRMYSRKYERELMNMKN